MAKSDKNAVADQAAKGRPGGGMVAGIRASEPPASWTDLQIQRLGGAECLHPIITEQTRTACQNEDLRVEHNLVRDVATGQQGPGLRVVPLDDSHYVSVVVPVLLDGRLLLVGRYRYAIGRWSIELPRAYSKSDETGWKHTAEKQLLDPLGLKATKITLLGALEPDSALIATNTIVILAEGCIERRTKPANPGELIAGTVPVSTEELDHLARRGEISCGITLAACYLFGAMTRR